MKARELDRLAHTNGWEVMRMGPLAVYTRGSVTVTATGVPRVSRAEIMTGKRPAEPFNPKSIRAVLEAK